MKNQVFWVIGILAVIGLIYWQREPITELASETMGKFTRSQFIHTYAPIAKIAAKGTGLFPSVFMAQAILESGNGNSSLTKQANNFFGIKADKSWTGNFVVKDTTEYVNGIPVLISAKFRAYPNALASFYDRVNFLKVNTRYKNAGVFIAPSPESQAIALQKAGYATDPAYSDLLIKLINQNNLKQFDV
jgi:flagellum-specific peptidoglycan hydrolase FlgJ